MWVPVQTNIPGGVLVRGDVLAEPHTPRAGDRGRIPARRLCHSIAHQKTRTAHLGRAAGPGDDGGASTSQMKAGARVAEDAQLVGGMGTALAIADNHRARASENKIECGRPPGVGQRRAPGCRGPARSSQCRPRSPDSIWTRF